mgnify:CR=1 FL=1
MEKTCVMCNRKITLNENLSGVVFKDEHFLCEDCSNRKSEEDIFRLTKTIMQDPDQGMPIALWLIHEQNKEKDMMARRK